MGRVTPFFFCFFQTAGLQIKCMKNRNSAGAAVSACQEEQCLANSFFLCSSGHKWLPGKKKSVCKLGLDGGASGSDEAALSSTSFAAEAPSNGSQAGCLHTSCQAIL